MILELPWLCYLAPIMPRILYIETSTDICSVCIAEGDRICSIRETPRSYSHSEVIAVFIDECLKEASLTTKELDAVAISRGPGSYTALRIGAATAKGICFAMDIPLVSIGTLEALADAVIDKAEDNDIIIPLIDARRMEAYHMLLNNKSEVILPVEPIILDEHSFKELEKYSTIHFLGDGVPKMKEVISISNAQFYEIECSSRFMIKRGIEKFNQKIFEDISYYEPHYYKGANITVQKKNILR